MKATIENNGALLPIPNCYIKIQGYEIPMNVLPDISDGKSAVYNDEPVIGRSFPMKTYSHSDNRAISWTAYFISTSGNDIETNLAYLRLIESAVYPRDVQSLPYAPPPVCSLKCGHLLDPSTGNDVCAVMKSYSVKFPTDVAWHEGTNLPYKFSVDMQFDIIYESSKLPGQEMIMGDARILPRDYNG
jgi:hypothetical protein